MGFRLHSRLVALNAAVIIIVTMLLVYSLGSGIQTTVISEIQDHLFRSSSLAQLYVHSHPQKTDPVALSAEIAAALDVRVTLIAPDGRVLGDSEVPAGAIPTVQNHRDRQEFIDARESGRGASVRWSATLGMSLVYVATRLEDGRVLRLAMPLSTMSALLGQLRRQLILPLLVAILATVIMGYMVYHFVSVPLRSLAEASVELAHGNLNKEVPLAGDRDLAALGASLNSMAQTLKRRMEELEADRKRIESIVTAMSAGVVVFEPDRRVVLANDAAQKFLGLHGSPMGRLPMELLRNPSIESAVRGALAGSEVSDVEVMTGSGRTLLMTARPVRTLAGSVELAVVMFHDVSEIRKTERMRKDFIANVSHEFKTPLTSIKGYAETLLSSAPENRELQREFLEAIDRNASLLHVLVDDLLVLARLESEPPVDKQRIEIREVLEELVRSREQLLKEREVTVELQVPELEITADRARLARALGNLIDNAIYYNIQGGTIRITARPNGDTFVIEVADTGIGIPQEDLSRIFQRFYRVDKSRIRDSGGTGLGLSIAKHAVESQGGTIAVESRLGKGATFTITLRG